MATRRSDSTKSILLGSQSRGLAALAGLCVLGAASCGGDTDSGAGSGGASSSAQSGGAGSGSVGPGGGAKATGGAGVGTTGGTLDPRSTNLFAARLTDGSCLPRQLQIDSAGRVPCVVVEALPMACESCSGELGRGSVSTEVADTVRQVMREEGSCGGAETPGCDVVCFCAIPQLQGSELERCRTESVTPADLSGFCYIDSGQGIGNAQITTACPPSQKRLLRFAGDAAPRSGIPVFLVCSPL